MFQVTGSLCGIIGKFTRKTSWGPVQLLSMTSATSNELQVALDKNQTKERIKTTETNSLIANLKEKADEPINYNFSKITALLQDVENGKIKPKDSNQLLSDIKKIMSEQNISDEELTSSDSRYEQLKQLADSYKAGEYANMVSTYGSLTTPGMIKVLEEMNKQKKKNLPLVKYLYHEITQYNATLTSLQCWKLLDIMVNLDFPNRPLLSKIGDHLSTSKNIPIWMLGNIATSLGMLRYKDSRILDIMCTNILYSTEPVPLAVLFAVLQYIAAVYYKTPKVHIFINQHIYQLSKNDFPDQIKWVNFVWSLVVLNLAQESHYQEIFSEEFINVLKGSKLTKGVQLKLLNIRAAAELHFKKDNLLLNGFTLPPLDFLGEQISVNNYKQKFLQTLDETLKEVLKPPATYTMGVDTGMGFSIDALCYVDKTMKFVENDGPNVKKIAIMLHLLSDDCRKEQSPIGRARLTQQLLEGNGYSVVSIDEKFFCPSDILYKRARYVSRQLFNEAGSIQLDEDQQKN